MTTPLKPYPKMKDSGVEWLGEVPVHWEVRRTKTILGERSQKGFPDEPLLAATQTKGVVRKEEYENRTVLALKDLHLLKLVKVNDFVISLRSFQGGIEYARVQGIISPAYTILFPLKNENHPFLAYLFKSCPYIENLTLHVTGIRQGQNIDYEKLSRSRIPLPPPSEQTAIVRYLDYMDRRIRRLIRAKRKLITLLNEQKQVIIHHAVTRGLDPNVPLKDSGVEWLGVVPEHWEVMRCGQIIQLTTGFPFKSDGFSQSEQDIRLLRGINISPGTIRWDEVVRWPSEERHLFEAFELAVNDIVLGMDRPIISTGMRVVQVCENDIPCLLLQRVARIRPVKKLSTTFFLHILAGKSFMDYLSPIFTGISVPHLSPEQIRLFRLAVPPLAEQTAIVKHIDQATSTLDTTITRAQREIDLLTEYRTRLIADVVTGKVDVREVAAGLPEVDPLAGVEEAEDGFNGNDEGDVGDDEGLAEEVGA